jgi:hypothetical protein
MFQGQDTVAESFQEQDKDDLAWLWAPNKMTLLTHSRHGHWHRKMLRSVHAWDSLGAAFKVDCTYHDFTIG